MAPEPSEASLVAHVVQGAAVVREAVRASALLPGRLSYVGAIGRQHAVTVVVQVVQIEVAPARFVGHVGQMAAIRRKRGLKNSRRFISGQPSDVFQAGNAITAGGHLRGSEQRAVPRHLGMIPFDPGDPISLRMPARLHVKVRAHRQLFRPRSAFGIDNCQAVHVLIGVHENDPALVGRNRRRRGVTERRCQRFGGPSAKRLAVQPPTGFAEIGPAARNAEITAPVADPGSHRKRRRQVPRRFLPRRQAYQHPTVGAPLQPYQGLAIAIPRHIRQP